MNIESLRLKRALRAALLVLLLGAAGMGKGYAQNFTVGDLKYSVNSDGTTVTVTGLKDVTFTGPLVIPESVTYNGVAYPVTTIGQHAFAWYDGFTGNLTIPNSVITICDWAFSGSGFTGNLIIGNSVTTIGDWAFYDCGFIGNLTIPNSVTTIGEIAFSHCSGLTSLIIGNSVTTIGYGAFTHCSGLTTVTFGYTVSEIGQGAFSSCDGLTAVYYTGSIAQWCGIIFVDSGANPLNNGSSLYINGTIVTDLVIPYGVTIIMPYAFCGGSFTGTLTIPNSVTYIGERAFWKCSSLTGSLTIPNSVTTIGNSAFSHCNGFAGSLTIPNSVTTIGSSAFSNCSGFIGDLTIPNSVTTIESILSIVVVV